MNASLWIALGIIMVGLGWYLRMWWEELHPRYIVIPDMSEDRDNSAALQHAIDVAAKLKGRIKIVRVPAGSYRTGSVHIEGEGAH